MDDIFARLSDPAFLRLFYNLSIVAMVLALGALVVGLAFYGRGKDPLPQDKVDARWTLLFATWRDSLIITLLFVADSFGYDMLGFQGGSQILPNTLLFYAPDVQPILAFVLHVLIFTVAALRVVAISRWLAREAA